MSMQRLRYWLFLACFLGSLCRLASADDPLDVVTALETATANAIERAQPSVVAITRIPSKDGQTHAIRGVPAPPEEQLPETNVFPPEAPIRPGFPNDTAPEYFALPGEFGSGVVIGASGEILTTYHLVRGAQKIRVRAPGSEFDAEILAADPRTDLAVIAPRKGTNPAPKLPPLPMGDAGALRQGSFLVALGNPYNSARDGKATASMGILANRARRLDPAQSAPTNIRQFFKYQPTLLQLDSKLNLGMSGGAVINLKGELVAITTAEASPDGFDAAAGYAIPMDALGRRAVDALIQGREVEYGFIGIGLSPREPSTVSDVLPGTPAWKANLATGDRILRVGDVELDDDESALHLAMATVPVGKPVTLKVLHEGEVVERTLVMSKYPVMGGVIATNRPANWRGARIDFTSVMTDGMTTGRTLESMTRGGVGVVEVEADSAAEAGGLTSGSVITAVENTPVSTPGEFRDAVAALEGKPVTIEVAGFSEGKRLVIAPR
jgi:S1-C subfamily serine protease